MQHWHWSHKSLCFRFFLKLGNAELPFVSRWDIQQMRQERIHENLRQKQREREDPSQAKQKSKPPICSNQSLHPSPGNGIFLITIHSVGCISLFSKWRSCYETLDCLVLFKTLILIAKGVKGKLK